MIVLRRQFKGPEIRTRKEDSVSDESRYGDCKHGVDLDKDCYECELSNAPLLAATIAGLREKLRKLAEKDSK